MKVFLYLLIAVFIAGCGETYQKPKILGENSKKEYAKNILSTYNKKDIKTDKLEAQTKKEIAMIEMKKTIETEKIKAQKELQIAKIQKDKELEKSKLELEVKKEENSITKTAIIMVSLLSLALLFLLFYLFSKRQETKIAIEREKIKAQKELKEKELKAKMAEKLIEAIANGKLTKEQEDKLISLANGKNIIEYKRG